MMRQSVSILMMRRRTQRSNSPYSESIVKEIKRLSKYFKMNVLFVLFITLTGCAQVNDLVSQQVEEITSSESESAASDEFALDQRLVPEFSQVERDLYNLMQPELKEEAYFRSNDIFTLSQDSFQLNVEEFRVYEMSPQSSDRSDTRQEDIGAVFILDISLINLTADVFYFPIEELRLSYRGAAMSKFPDSVLYPAPSGDLMKILSAVDGEIGPGMTVEGYLTYSLTLSEWQTAKSNGSIYLSVMPPQSNLSAMVGAGTSNLGEERDLFLPLNSETNELLIQNGQRVPDRLTSEWWGDKIVLAEESINETVENGDVTIRINRIEMSDFIPQPHYELNFQNFMFGQIIVSIELEVVNHSEFNLLPIDGRATLQIGEDMIHSDYTLINELYGTVLESGESLTVIHSFALDKMRYQQVWQKHPINISLSIPVEYIDYTVGEVINSDNISEFYFESYWVPELEKFINEDLEVVANLDVEINPNLRELLP